MIKAIYSINGIINVEYDASKVLKEYEKKPSLIWIDIYLKNHELNHEEMLLLSKSFHFHEMSIEDCLFSQYYPKIEEFENYVFGAIHGIQLKPNYFYEFEDSIYELNFFVGKSFIVTAHTEKLFFLETLFEKAKIRPQVEMKSLENVLYNIFSKVVSSYEFTLEKIDGKMDDLEDDVLADPDEKNMEEILYTKKVIFEVRKIAEYQQSAYIFFTRSNNNLIAREYLVYFRDICTQCAGINQAIIMRNQMIVSLIEVHMTSVTLKLSEVMKFLTLIATLLMPVFIISGYYGMNVKFPEHSFLGEKGTWFFAIMFVVVTMGSALIYFKKKKWF